MKLLMDWLITAHLNRCLGVRISVRVGCRIRHEPNNILALRYASPRAITAQTMRAVLLASATAATLAGLHASSPRTHAASFVVRLRVSRRMAASAMERRTWQ